MDIISMCNQCKEYKKLEHFRVVNDHLNYNARMKVCIACVNKNKLKYISEELKYIQHYISYLINEMSIVCEND